VPERELRTVLSGPHGRHAILDVVLQGQKTSHASILKDYQVDPVRGGVTHVDLQEVRLDRPIQASVTVSLLGAEDAPGVREGGVLSQPLRELTVQALPLEVPEHIDVDVSEMEIGGTLRVSDVTVPDGVTVLDELESVVATVTAPTRVVEPEEELVEGEEEAAEGETPGGEAAESAAEAAEDAAGAEDTTEG
jgi:large subunit ribosomal protein L25